MAVLDADQHKMLISAAPKSIEPCLPDVAAGGKSGLEGGHPADVGLKIGGGRAILCRVDTVDHHLKPGVKFCGEEEIVGLVVKAAGGAGRAVGR